MRIAVVPSNLCDAYGLHSELLRSAFLVLSILVRTIRVVRGAVACEQWE